MSTEIEKELLAHMKAAMKARDKVALAAIRMARSKVTEARTAKGAGELDDTAIRGVIASYVKSLGSALDEFRANGTPEDDDNIVTLTAEIAVLQRWMPQLLSEDETRAIVAGVIADNGLAGAKMMGRGMGLVMKSHKGKVDANLVKKLMLEGLA
ncbi:MAG: GatB/YqeY domain-containing protein [Myxococcales bacterium]|nr:GatB/YqeY domain-containing protein [Myxococcales bacterium]